MDDPLATTPRDIEPELVTDDLLNGVDNFAEFTGWTRQRCYYLLERGLLPGGKIGNRWIGSKRAVTAYLTKIATGLRA